MRCGRPASEGMPTLSAELRLRPELFWISALSSISITGYGIDARGRIDSHFRSISQLFEHQGVDEIMFARTDTASGEEHFAKTTLYIDKLGRRNWRSGPTFMRAQSVLYGHDEDGVRHADIILRRATPGSSEARIVEEMCGEGLGEGAALPDATLDRPPAGRPALVP